MLHQSLTAAMCNYTSFPHIFEPLLFNQSAQCMKRSSCFERPNSLLILALEEQTDFGLGFTIGRYSIRLTILAFALCGRGYGIERIAGYNGCQVDVRFDALVSCLNGLPGEWWAG